VTRHRSFSDTIGGVEFAQVLGAVAHRGGVIVDHETLRVGVVQMVSRTSGLQITVVARRPADRRSTAERQAAIRAGDVTPGASRLLLPSSDEGMELRLGWLDSDRHARWEYPHSSESSSGSADGEEGPSLRATFVLPPLFEAMTLLLAWPEIGFPETSIELALPDAVTVERASVSIWDAGLPELRMPSWARQVTADLDTVPIAEESGTVIAQPRTLRRSADAALVLTRLSAYKNVLQATITGVARGTVADQLGCQYFPPIGSSDDDLLAFFGRAKPVFGLVQDNILMTAAPGDGTATGGPGIYETETRFAVPRPADHQPLQLAVGWPQAGLDIVEIVLPPDIGDPLR